MKECLKKNKLLLVVTAFFSVITSVGNAVVAIFLQKIIDVTMGKNFNGFLNVLLATLVSVSYTHLDVYKRQGINCPIYCCKACLNRVAFFFQPI